MSNVQLGSINGDYDGDMISSKGSFYVETNDELKANLYSKSFFIDFIYGYLSYNFPFTTNGSVLIDEDTYTSVGN